MNEGQDTPKKNLLWIWVVVLIVAIAIIGYLVAGFLKKDNAGDENEQNISTNDGPVEIPAKTLLNKFGWLGGAPDDKGDGIIAHGGLWVRPHPGPFVWDMMQKSSSGEISFDDSDAIVKGFASNNIAVLGTLWPFADWDQKNLADLGDCQVLNNDEFLPKNDKKGRSSYLPQYRCNPSDWAAYQKWISAIVERYDGDGKNDMPGLKIPIKYWEVMNEPDLQYQNNQPPLDKSSSLNFYKQGPAEYATLLINTDKAIKSADPEAKVLIAGAAGADDRMLGFFREVFKNPEAKISFDIGNIHCISNDQATRDFNVSPYKNMLAEFGLSQPIWVTEAEAMYGKTAEENYQSTKASTDGAMAAGAQRVFFTRDSFDDFRTDMSQKNEAGSYASEEKFREITKSY